MTVAPAFTTGGVLLEIVDSAGAGFRTILDWPKAIDMALKTAVAVARLRGLPGTTP